MINPATSISYTNKQFSDIYPEMLDLVLKLSSKWDPSTSNESDPGVILLKLNAIIGDKLNYNIDKNIQELFPDTVSLISNARKLYRLLGYYMHWYESATVSVSITWTGDIPEANSSEERLIIIPAFTLITNENRDIVYTLLGIDNGSGNINVSNIILPKDGNPINCIAIEGSVEKYKILDDDLIKASMLDKDRRVYLAGTSWAENGVFITNKSQLNYSLWKRVDNLVAEALNNRYYEFGVTDDEYSCYIEFPEDYDNIIGEGIYIYTIRTNGTSGKIIPQELSLFVSESDLNTSDNELVINGSTVSIINNSASVGGKDYETIQEANKQYKKFVNTLDTLVTIRDYTNYLTSSNLVSNGFVTDKTTDPLCSYLIVNKADSTSSYINKIEKVLNAITGVLENDPSTTATVLVDQDALSYIDRKIYGLLYLDEVNSRDSFLQTFSFITTALADAIKSYIDNYRCIGLDWKEILPTSAQQSHICLIKNVYKVSTNIFTSYTLTSLLKDNLRSSINKALYNELNSKELELGLEVLEQDIINIIKSSDNRIKDVSIKELSYVPYATVYEDGKYKDICLSSDTSVVEYSTELDLSKAFNPQQGYTLNDICVYNGARYKCAVSSIDAGHPFLYNLWSLFLFDSSQFLIDEDTFVSKVGDTNYEYVVLTYDDENDEYVINDTEDPEDYGISFTTTSPLPTFEGISSISIRISKSLLIKDEIYVKSMLSGATPFVNDASEIHYKFNLVLTNKYNDIKYLSSNVSITLDESSNTYRLRDNEYIQLFAPNFIDISEYSGSVKFEYYITHDVQENLNYTLLDSEYIIFYYKIDGAEGELYNYNVYASGCIILPTFSLSAKSSQTGIIGSSLAASINLRNIGTLVHPMLVADSDYNGSISTLMNEQLSGLTQSSNILSGKKSIHIKKENIADISVPVECYFITNNIETDSSYNSYYVLFELGETERILNTGETFIYFTDPSRTTVYTLGAGSKISRSDSSGKWRCPAINLLDYVLRGISALKDYLLVYPTQGSITLAEQLYITLTPGCALKLESELPSWKVEFNRTGVTLTTAESLADFTISYSTKIDPNTYTTLDTILSGSSSGWDGRSLLSINTDSETFLPLLLNLQVSLYDNYEGAASIPVVTISGANKDTSNHRLVGLISEGSVLADGTSTVCEIEKTNFFKLYLLYSYSSTGYEVMYADNSVSILFEDPSTVNQATLQIAYPSGDYIFNYVINNDSEDGNLLRIGEAGSTVITRFLNQFIDGGSQIFRSNDFIKMSLTEASSLITQNMLVECDDAYDQTITITISNLEKYNYGDLSSTDWLKYGKLITKFDYDNQYNYLYKADDSILIKNPISAESFFTSNHPFNSVTLSLLNTDDIILLVK